MWNKCARNAAGGSTDCRWLYWRYCKRIYCKMLSNKFVDHQFQYTRIYPQIFNYYLRFHIRTRRRESFSSRYLTFLSDIMFVSVILANNITKVRHILGVCGMIVNECDGRIEEKKGHVIQWFWGGTFIVCRESVMVLQMLEKRCIIPLQNKTFFGAHFCDSKWFGVGSFWQIAK